MSLPPLRIRSKIILGIVGISLATVTAMSAVVVTFIKPQLVAKLEKRGLSISHAISSQCINPILTRKPMQLELFFREFIRLESGVEYIYVLDSNGAVTAHSFDGGFPTDLKKLKPVIDRDGHGTARISAADRDIIDISAPLLDGTLGRIHVGMAVSSIKSDVNEILVSFISIVALFFLSSLAMLFFLESWVIRPILKLTEASIRAGEGDLEQKVEVVSADEIGNLAAAFNRMLDSVKESRETLLSERDLLAESEARLKTIIEKSPLSMAIVAMDGTIEYINSCAVKTFGYRPEVIPNMEAWWQVAYPDPDYREQVIAKWLGLLEKALAGGSGYIERREYRVTCSNGTVKTMLIFGVIITDKVFVMFEDITTRKQAENEVQRLNTGLEKIVAERTDELLRINRDLSSFCYAISHELRAPIARLKGLSAALQEDWAENPADALHCTKRIEVACNELQLVINAVLQLSRLSQTELVPTPIDLSSIARNIANSLAIENSGRRFEVTIAENVTANGDAALMRLCLENLLGNAFKYTARQPIARIEFGQDAVSGELFVRDNGIGFDMSHADNLFEPFTRLHPEDEFIGSGIGLATVQRIIERHGGKIRAESAPGEGATFYFTLSPAKGGRHVA